MNCPICSRETDDYGWCDDCAEDFPREELDYLSYSMAEWAANRARESEREKAKVLVEALENIASAGRKESYTYGCSGSQHIGVAKQALEEYKKE